MTQTERVLRALELAGDHGITQVDFLAPNVCDDGPPVTRLSARIMELRVAGHTITAAGKRDRCRRFVLHRPVMVTPVPAGDERLFTPAPGDAIRGAA